MKIPKFMTKPSGLVRRIRRSSRYWQGYGEGSEPAYGPKWRFYSLPELKSVTFTEPVNTRFANYTLDEYVEQGRDKRYSKAFMYLVTPGKPRLTQEQMRELDGEKIRTICDLLVDELIEDIGIKPTKRYDSEVLRGEIRPPKIHYNYNEFNWGTVKFEHFTQFDIFVVPSEELSREHGKIVQSNIFGYIPPRFILRYVQ